MKGKQSEWWFKQMSLGHKYKIVLEVILEFLHQYDDDCFTNPEKPNWSVKDFKLEQFQRRIGKKIDETDEQHKHNI